MDEDYLHKARRLKQSGLKQSKGDWTKYSKDYSRDNSRNLSRDVSKENIKDKYNISTNKSISRNKPSDLSKTKSTKKSSVHDSQSHIYKPLNSNETDKRIYTHTHVTNIPKKTDSKYNQPGYTACISEKKGSIITEYKKIKPITDDKHKLLRLSDLQNDHSFSNKLEITHNNDVQLKSNSRRPIDNHKSSTYQSSFSVEDTKQVSNKRFESIEEKYFNIINILQSSKKDMWSLEAHTKEENPKETVSKVDEREII